MNWIWECAHNIKAENLNKENKDSNWLNISTFFILFYESTAGRKYTLL